MSTNYNTTEEWRDIPGYERYYQVSNHGRVRSVDRIIPYKYEYTNGFRKYSGKIMVSNSLTRGYNGIMLCKQKDNKKYHKRHQIHRLVLMAFVGLPPTPKHECNHKNGVKTDNHINNLEWVTRSENVKHAYDNLDRYRNTGKLNGQSKLTGSIASEIRQLYATKKYTQEELGKLYNVHQMTISDVIRRISWKHVA